MMSLRLQNARIAILGGVLLIFNLMLFYYIFHIYKVTNNNYIYPLDDSYIHLSVAKNVVMHGNWGLLPDEFVSTISSPIYTMLVALMMMVFGDSVYHLLVLNIILSNLLIVMLYSYFRNNIIRFLFMFLFLLSPVLLHVQVISGMEHIFHMIILLSAFILLEKIISTAPGEQGGVTTFQFLFFVSLLCLSRFESMFFIAGMIAVLIFFARYRLAFLTLVIGFLPVVLFGWFSLSKGGYFFPNSLLIKGNLYPPDDYLLIIQDYLIRLGNVPLFLIVCLIVYKFLSTTNFRIRDFPEFIKDNYLLFLVLVTVGQHSLFAKFGWLYRYEAYLYLLVCFMIVRENYQFSSLTKDQPIARRAATLILILAVLFESFHVIRRYYTSAYVIKFAGKNVYDQHIQTSLFLKKYYKGATVLANDVGAITYFADIKLIDPVGLGSQRILKLLFANQGNKVPFSEMVKAYPINKPTIYVIYESWYKQQLEQDGLIKAGETQIKDNVICGDTRVSFFADNKEEAARLSSYLEEFKASVPPDVSVTINR